MWTLCHCLCFLSLPPLSFPLVLFLITASAVADSHVGSLGQLARIALAGCEVRAVCKALACGIFASGSCACRILCLNTFRLPPLYIHHPPRCPILTRCIPTDPTRLCTTACTCHIPQRTITATILSCNISLATIS